MSENSAIEWTDHTFNPWIGCTKVSPGCDHCYAARQDGFRKWTPAGWGAGQPRRRTSAANWSEPAKWNRRHAAFFAEHGRRQRVFCASLADVFDNEVPPMWRVEMLGKIAAAENLDWLLLTKRIGNVERMLVQALELAKEAGMPALSDWLRAWVMDCRPPANVWLGATIVNQEEADRDIPKLQAVPARVRFLSCEPLLGPVDFRKVPGFNRVGLDLSGWWVIVGGESGPGARPMHPDAARRLRDQCSAAGVPFLFKQWGCWAPGSTLPDSIPSGEYCDFDGDLKTDDERVWKVPKKLAGRLLDGVQHDGFPAPAVPPGGRRSC